MENLNQEESLNTTKDVSNEMKNNLNETSGDLKDMGTTKTQNNVASLDEKTETKNKSQLNANNSKNAEKGPSSKLPKKKTLLIGSSGSKKFKLFLGNIRDDLDILNEKSTDQKLFLGSLSFDMNKFKECYKQIDVILFFDNLTPRPEALVYDFKILTDIFSKDELRNKLFFIFLSANTSLSLEELRENFFDFTMIFDSLKINSITDKITFVKQRTWLLRELYFYDIINEINALKPENPMCNLM